MQNPQDTQTSQGHHKKLESRTDSQHNGWFEKQEEEVLPFETSASAAKLKAAELLHSSPSPFSPAQQTPQKVNNFENAGQLPITPVAGKSDNDQARIADNESTLDGGNYQNQFRSVAQGRKQIQPTFIPPSISHQGFGSNNPKNSKIIREKHLQMQKQHNANQNFGVNSSAYSSSQQSISGMPSNHMTNLSSNTALSPVVNRGIEHQSGEFNPYIRNNQAQLMSLLYQENQNGANAVSQSVDYQNQNLLNNSNAAYDPLHQSQEQIQNSQEPRVNNFMTPNNSNQIFCQESSTRNLGGTTDGKENFNTQNSSARHQRSGHLSQFLTQPGSEHFGSTRAGKNGKNSARLVYNQANLLSIKNQAAKMAPLNQVEPPRVIAGRSGHQQSLIPESVKQDLRSLVHGEQKPKNSNSLGNLDQFTAMDIKTVQNQFVKGGLDFKQQEAIQQIFNQSNQQFEAYSGVLKQNSHSKDNAQNIKKIQQLALGDSPPKLKNPQQCKGSNDEGVDSNGKDSSSNTLERDSKVEVVRELEDDLNEAAKVQPGAEDTVNELTMNDMTMNQESSHNIFTQEREYDPAQFDRAQHQVNGPPDSQGGKLGAPNFVSQSLALGANSQSESNLIMRTSSNNEHTSSSLGKRNYNDYSKKQSGIQDQIAENKSSGKKGQSAVVGYVSKGPVLQMIDEQENQEHNKESQLHQLNIAQQVSEASNPEIEKRLKKTPARRMKTLRRQKSDIFGKEQVQQSGQKLLKDDSNKNDDSSNNVHAILAGNQFRPMRSDVMMSSQDGDDNTYEALGIQPGNSQIIFQKMGLNGQPNQAQCYPVYKYRQVDGQVEFQQHPGDQACSACAFENGTQKSGSTVEGIQNNQNMNFVQPAQQIASCNQSQSNDIRGKDTPNFLKQKFSKNPIRADLAIEEAMESQGVNFYNKVVEKEMQEPTVKPFAFHQTVNNNFGNVVVLNEQMRQTMPLMQTSLRQSICAMELQNTQKKDSILQESDPQSVRRQLFAEQTISNSSSNIQTPIQQKRMKFAMDSQNQEGSKRSNKVFEMNQNQPNPLYRPEIVRDGNPLFANQNFNGFERQRSMLYKQKSFNTKDGESPQSWVQRWRCSDPIFNKYSSGATPPQKSRPSNASIFREGDQLSNLEKSQSLHFTNQANQTLPKQQVKKIVANQNQHDMGRTMSPNELKVLSSEQESNVNREQHDQVRQTLKFDENSDMTNQEPHTRSNPNPPFLSNAQRTSDMEPPQVQKSLFQSMNERRQQQQIFQVSEQQQQEIFNSQARVLNSMIPVVNRDSRPLVPQNLQIALIQTENGPQESSGDTYNLFAQNQGAFQPYILNMQQPGRFNPNRTISSVSGGNSHAGISVHTCMKQRSTIKSNGGPKTPVHNNHGFMKRNSQISVTNTSMNDQSVFSSSLDTEGVGGQFNPKKRRPPQTKVGQIDPIRKLQLHNQPMFTKSFSSSQNFQQNLASTTVKSIEQELNKSKSQINPRDSEGFIAAMNQNQPNLAPQITTVSNTKKVSWLDKEFNRIERIGRGHFGQVLKCQNKTDSFEYAIKVTHCRIRCPEEQAICLQELQTLSALSVEAECPHIVRYFNSWIEDDRIHIVMELCEKSLRKIKEEARAQLNELMGIKEDYLMKIIRDVLLGLSELHNKDIVHLDIKPENILMGKTGNFKIADLGMARFLTKITEDANIPEGDCRYLAKELLSRTELPDLKKSDIFSLGITAFELITLGKLEKNGPEWNQLRDGTFCYPPQTLQNYSPELLQTVTKMLAPDANDRPSADELLETMFASQEQRKIRELMSVNSQLNEKLYRLSEFLKQRGYDAEQVIQEFDINDNKNQ